MNNSGIKRWGLMADPLGEPSPLPDRHFKEDRRSNILRRRSNQATEHIKQRLAAIDDVVTSATPTKLQGHGVSGGATPSLLKPPHQEQLHMVSIMDESGMIKDFQFIPTPSRDTTMMSPNVSSWGDKELSILHDLTSQAEPDTTFTGDPNLQVGQDLMVGFHHYLTEYPSPGQILELLDSFEQACSNQIGQLKSLQRYNDTYLRLKLEQNTWELACVLYNDRLGDFDTNQDDMVDEIKPRTDRQIVDDYYQDDYDIRQAQLVVDWLEKVAGVSLEEFPKKIKYLASSVSWENTIHAIANGIAGASVVTQVDPDAPTRQHKHLADLDEQDELVLVKHLFKFIRAGQLEKAKELCVQCGQSWRAASLDGWKLYHDPNLTKDIDEGIEDIEGNEGRDLWKLSCWELANSKHFSVYEKAIYAALSGNIKHLLPACHSWYDCVWAYFKVMVDVLVEQKIRSANRYPGGPMQDMPKEYWSAIVTPEAVFSDVEAVTAEIRNESTDKYHVAQKHIILGTLDTLIDEMYTWLNQKCDMHQLRFMAHMTIFTITIGTPCDNSKCDGIIQAFINVLIQHGYYHLVALYTSYLPPQLQITSYSKLMEDISIHDLQTQKQCLELARKNGLDVSAISKSVVEKIRRQGKEDIPESFVYELGQDVKLTESDQRKIKILDWLLFDEAHRNEAIYQANAIIREFLAVRKHSAASEVFRKLPQNSIDVLKRTWKMKFGDAPLSLKLTNDIKEHLCIQAYLEAIDLFNGWFQEYHHNKPGPPPPEPKGNDFQERVAHEQAMESYQSRKLMWENNLSELCESVEKKIHNVLLFVEGGWMVDQWVVIDGGDSECEMRQKQMKLLRQVCIPQLCFLLHNVLHSAGYYKKCLQLADIVASERHQLYSVFQQEELRHFLHLCHSSSLEVVATVDLDPLGYPIA